MNRKCKQCKDIWFVAHKISKKEKYICPHCSMPLIQMIRDVYEVEGIRGVCEQIYKRYYK